MALNGLICAEVPLRIYSLHSSPHPNRVGPSAPQFSRSLLFTQKPFVAELPNLTR